MMRLVFRVCGALTLSFLLVPAGFADGPAKAKAKTKAKKSETVSADAATSETQPAAKSEAAAGAIAKEPAPVPQGTRGAGRMGRVGGMRGRGSEAPQWTPMPATSGTLGLFTVETGETLPAHGFSFSTYVNKFSRMPGSITVLNLGWNFGVGLSDWLTLYTQFEPYRHVHVSRPGELSLNTPCCDPINFPPFPNATNPTIYRRLGPGLRPAYVEDYPFAFTNDGGVGEVTVGLKIGFLSEKRGSPVSFGVRNDFIFPTRTNLTDLLDNGTQSGQFNYAFTVSLSKTWPGAATFAINGGYRFTRDPRFNGQPALTQADQARVGAGILLFPDSRLQLMNEYTGVIFTGSATPNSTFGVRDPVDGVWGVRLYPWRSVALDVGYRYMINLRNAHDRHGFVVKLGAVPSAPSAPPARAWTTSASASSTTSRCA